MSVEAFEKAVGPKELHWIDGPSHVDRYDKPENETRCREADEPFTRS